MTVHQVDSNTTTPLTAVVVTTAHTGTLPASHSFASVAPENVVLTAVKKAEDAKGLIFRVYEWAGKDATVEFHVPPGATSATVTNMQETPEGSALTVSGDVVKALIHPYEILTVRVDYALMGGPDGVRTLLGGMRRVRMGAPHLFFGKHLGQGRKSNCRFLRSPFAALRVGRNDRALPRYFTATFVRSAFWSIWLRRYISSASRLVLMGWVERSIVSPGACAPSPVAPMPARPGRIPATNAMSPAPRFIGSSSGMGLNPRLALAWLRMRRGVGGGFAGWAAWQVCVPSPKVMLAVVFGR